LQSFQEVQDGEKYSLKETLSLCNWEWLSLTIIFVLREEPFIKSDDLRRIKERLQKCINCSKE